MKIPTARQPGAFWSKFDLMSDRARNYKYILGENNERGFFPHDLANALCNTWYIPSDGNHGSVFKATTSFSIVWSLSILCWFIEIF